MSKIKKILVPVDGSVNGCKAVDEAIFFAQSDSGFQVGQGQFVGHAGACLVFFGLPMLEIKENKVDLFNDPQKNVFCGIAGGFDGRMDAFSFERCQQGNREIR